MKRLTVTKFSLGNQTASTIDLVSSVANYINPKTGLTAGEMRNRFRILDSLDNSDGITINFEDADAMELKKLCNVFPWGVVCREVVAFCEEVETWR